MSKGFYNFIITLCVVLIVIVVLMMGSYFWYQHKLLPQTAKQSHVTTFQPQKTPLPPTQTAKAVLPKTPLRVSVNGRTYPIDFIAVRDDKVTISTKHELGKFPDLEINIRLNNQHIRNFSNRNLHFSGQSFSDPQLQVSWMEPGKNLPKNEFIFKNYNLQMQFGQEKDYRIPVQLKLATQEKVNVNAAGRFMAKTSDLVVVNGKVDLHQDNADTVMYVIAQFLKQTDKVSSLKSIKARSHSMSMPGKDTKPDPNPGRVYSSGDFSLEFESTHGKESAEFQMVRTNAGWQVYNVLKPERLKQALKPDLSLDTLFLFDYLGDQVVNKTIGKDKVAKWERKGSMLRHRDPDPKKDQTQLATATYLVTLKDNSQQYVKLLATKDKLWKVAHVFSGSQIPLAHTKESVMGFQSTAKQRFLSAVRLEKSLNKQYPDGLQMRQANFSCSYSNLYSQCRVTWRRLIKEKEQCEGTKYMFKREDKNAPWKFVRELAANEELDHRDGKVKKKDKPRKYHCW